MRMRAQRTAALPGDRVRFTAGALALFFAAAQIGGYAHLVLVPHARCAEHGEIIDVHGAGRADAGPSTDAAGPRLASPTTFDTGHRHEHCALGPKRREWALDAPVHHAIGAAPPIALRFVGGSHEQPPPAPALFRLAPKTSPPA